MDTERGLSGRPGLWSEDRSDGLAVQRVGEWFSPAARGLDGLHLIWFGKTGIWRGRSAATPEFWNWLPELVFQGRHDMDAPPEDAKAEALGSDRSGNVGGRGVGPDNLG